MGYEWKDYKCPEQNCSFTISSTTVPKCQTHKKSSMVLKK
jgi:hypothetical protein